MNFHGFVCLGLLSVLSFKINKPGGTWLWRSKSENKFYKDTASIFLQATAGS